MAENSKIEWTDHTFNPWIGCTKVSPGCDHCYAETLATARLGVAWGVGAERRRTAPGNWSKPRSWDRKAAKEGRRARVFCSSLADVFDKAAPDGARADLAALILATPNLDWLLLTKRIGNADAMLKAMFPDGTPDHVWLGATIVNQEEADRDIPKLLATDAAVRFLSMEPLLGPVNVEAWLAPEKVCQGCDDGEGYGNRCSRADVPRDEQCPWNRAVQIVTAHGPFSDDGMPNAITSEVRTVDWVIVGGESGGGARPMHPAWARSLRDQCAAAGVPFLFKQWGEWLPIFEQPWNAIAAKCCPDPADQSPFDHVVWDGDRWEAMNGCWDDSDSWYVAPNYSEPEQELARVGKKRAGRLLDGVQHDGMPA